MVYYMELSQGQIIQRPNKQELSSLFMTHRLNVMHAPVKFHKYIPYGYAGFQAGPTFPTIPTFPYFFLCSYFFLKMPYYPYFLVQKCLNWPKIVIFFLACSKFVKIGST